jgi:prepilin-type N-terminal cleavage/methylation domain-containing protein/prepilin-type processing-associated H-X9-DG protein
MKRFVLRKEGARTGRARKRPRSPAGVAKAFTLIELLVVVSIIALLISILLPSLRKARELARRAKCQGHLHMIALAVREYAADNNDFTPLGNSTEAQADPTNGWWGGNGVQNMLWVPGLYLPSSDEGKGTAIGSLYPKYIQDGHMYYCPSYRDALSESSFDDDTWGFVNWGNEALRNHVAGSYLYRGAWRTHQPGFENPTRAWLWATEPLNVGWDSQRAMVADGFTPNYWAIGGRVGHGDGYMVAYLDGHVAYVRDAAGREVRRFWPRQYDYFGYAITNEFAWLHLDQLEGNKLPPLVTSLEDAKQW